MGHHNDCKMIAQNGPAVDGCGPWQNEVNLIQHADLAFCGFRSGASVRKLGTMTTKIRIGSTS